MNHIFFGRFTLFKIKTKGLSIYLLKIPDGEGDDDDGDGDYFGCHIGRLRHSRVEDLHLNHLVGHH